MDFAYKLENECDPKKRHFDDEDGFKSHGFKYSILLLISKYPNQDTKHEKLAKYLKFKFWSLCANQKRDVAF